MTAFTEYLAAVRAYEEELKQSGMRSDPPLNALAERASEAEALFNRLVQAQVKNVAPAAVNSQLRGL